MFRLFLRKQFLLVQKHKILIFVIFLICFAGFLRFYNLPNIYIFGFDEEYQATYAMTLVKHLHLIWIGVSAGFVDYYMGPYFTYFTAFWLWISKGDPLITAYIAGLVGVATSVAIFFVGWKFFNLLTGMIASLLYAGLPLIVFYDQKYWNPMFVQLTVLLMFTSIMLIKRSSWWWVLYAALLGVIFETDLVPLPLSLIGIWFFLKGKYWLNKKLVLTCILVFSLFYWPLLVFDYFHNWSNITIFTRYSQQAKQVGAGFDPETKFLTFLDTMGRFWHLKSGSSNSDELNVACYSLSAKKEFKFIDRYSERTFPTIWFSLLSVILLLFFLVRALKEKKGSYRLLAAFLLVSASFYLFYSGGSFEYYLHGFITLFTLIPGIIISQINKKFRPLFLIILGIILVMGLNTILHSSDKFSLGPKKRLIGEVMKVIGNNNFSIEGMGACHNWEGWRYLFKIYGRTPTKSYTDSNFGWLYPKELSNDRVTYNIILSESRITPDKDVSGYYKIDEGGYTAYLKKLNNENMD